jgi:hypothetical protein
MLRYYIPNPTGAIKSLKEGIVLLVLQHLPVNISLRKVQQPSDLGAGGISNVAKVIIDVTHGIHLVFGAKVMGGYLYGFL